MYVWAALRCLDDLKNKTKNNKFCMFPVQTGQLHHNAKIQLQPKFLETFTKKYFNPNSGQIIKISPESSRH